MCRGRRNSGPEVAAAILSASATTPGYGLVAEISLADDEPETLLAAWTASRGQRKLFRANERAADLLAGPCLFPTCVSDPRSGISAAHVGDVWVAEADRDAVIRAHLLIAPESVAHANVVLHVAGSVPPRPEPVMLLVADQSDWGRPRESYAARPLIRGLD